MKNKQSTDRSGKLWAEGMLDHQLYLFQQAECKCWSITSLGMAHHQLAYIKHIRLTADKVGIHQIFKAKRSEEVSARIALARQF